MLATHEVPTWIGRQVYLRQALVEEGLLDQLGFLVKSLREGNRRHTLNEPSQWKARTP